MQPKKIVQGFKANVLFVSVVFLTWKLFTLVIAALGTNFLDFKASFPYSDTVLALSGLPQWLWHWGNFDGVHYLTIAKIGYDGFGTQVFFPLYPLLINTLTRITNSAIISGLVISNLSAFFAALFLFHFAKDKFDEKTAKWAIIFLFAFPTSFFLGAIYPESLLLLLILLTFTTKNIWAGIFAGLASGTKLVGVFLVPVLIFKNFWGFLGVTGVLAYLIFLWSKFNNPLIFLSAQSAFQNNRATTLASLVFPPQVLFRYFKIFTSASVANFDFWVAVLEFFAFIFGIAVLFIISRKKLAPTNILVFSWLALLLPTFSGTLSSMPRYLLPIFPIYIYLAKIQNTWLKSIILLISLILFGVLSTLFTRGYFVS